MMTNEFLALLFAVLAAFGAALAAAAADERAPQPPPARDILGGADGRRRAVRTRHNRRVHSGAGVRVLACMGLVRIFVRNCGIKDIRGAERPFFRAAENRRAGVKDHTAPQK